MRTALATKFDSMGLYEPYGTIGTISSIYYVSYIRVNIVLLYPRIGIIGSSVLFVPLVPQNDGGHMREKTLERKLVEAVKAMGGICPKFVSPGFDGMPDRLVLLPMGRIAFVEVKRKGEKPRPLQLSRHGTLRRLGFKVYVLDDEAQIKPLLAEMGGDAE
jgi:hypothetical protein